MDERLDLTALRAVIAAGFASAMDTEGGQLLERMQITFPDATMRRRVGDGALRPSGAIATVGPNISLFG